MLMLVLSFVVSTWFSSDALVPIVDSGQGYHAHFDWFVATQQTVLHCMFWQLSIKANIKFFRNLSYSIAFLCDWTRWTRMALSC